MDYQHNNRQGITQGDAFDFAIEGTPLRRDSKKKKKKKGLIWWFILPSLLIIIAAGAFWLYTNWSALFGNEPTTTNPNNALATDPNAQSGIINGDPDAQKRIDEAVEKSKFRFRINVNPVFANGSAQGNLNIENLKQNHFLEKVTLTLDDTNEVLYESGAIKPGQYIQYVTLNRALKKGTYNATAIATLYDMETNAKVGSVGAKVRIQILN